MEIRSSGRQLGRYVPALLILVQSEPLNVPQAARHTVPAAGPIGDQPAAVIRPVCTIRAVVERHQCLAFRLRNLGDSGAGEI